MTSLPVQIPEIVIRAESRSPLLMSYIDRYAAFRGLESSSVDQLRYSAGKVESFLGGSVTLADLDDETINQVVCEYRGKLSPSTLVRLRNSLLAIMRFAAKDIGLDPAFRPPMPNRDFIVNVKRPAPVPDAWTPEEIGRLLAEAEKLKGWYTGKILKRGYWQAYIYAAWDTGWRGCDLRRLALADIQDNGRVTISQQKTRKPITAQLREDSLRLIRYWLAHREYPFAPWRHLSTWRVRARNLIAAAGLDGELGKIRRSAGTATELAHPGKGYQFLGNTPDVFYKFYFDRNQGGELPQPPELKGGAA